MASRVDISCSEDSWLHTSHQLTDELKTNMNIVVKSNVRAAKGLGVSPRVFQTSQICDTHCLLPSPDHLCQPEAHRFWKHKILLFHLLCIQTTETMFVMHHYLVPGLFFMGKALGTRGQDRVATSQHSCWVRRGLVVQ